MAKILRQFDEKVRYLIRMGRTEMEARRIARVVDAIPMSHY